MAIAAARQASTVVLLRPASRFEVLLVRRSDSVAFMGGAHVFPGGRVDAADRIEGLDDIADGAAAAGDAMNDLGPADAVAHHVAALRELFEETGILLAGTDHGVVATDGLANERFAEHRRALLGGTRSLAEIVRLERLRLALHELTYFAHWVTPEIEIKRFDTRFFIARAPASQTPLHDNSELTDCEWLDPEDAIARCRNGGILLPPPTWTTLSALARFPNIDAALAWAGRRPVPRIQPRFKKDGESTLLFYPGDPLYPAVDGFDTPDETRFTLSEGRWRPVRPD
jgi:8-oxo-dGTP pyrophosphatase MutT (NUDIX family)